MNKGNDRLKRLVYCDDFHKEKKTQARMKLNNNSELFYISHLHVQNLFDDSLGTKRL